jgi:hypothetical protein
MLPKFSASIAASFSTSIEGVSIAAVLIARRAAWVFCLRWRLRNRRRTHDGIRTASPTFASALFIAALWLGFGGDAFAHSTAKGNCHFSVQDDATVEIQIDLTEEDILDLFDVDMSSEEEEPVLAPRMQSSMPRWLRLVSDGEACEVRFLDWTRLGVRSLRLSGMAQCKNQLEILTLHFGLSMLSSLKLICLTSITAPGNIEHTSIFSRKHTKETFAVKRPSAVQTVQVFFRSGAEHILGGWDHLAFLLGLLLLSTSWSRLIWVVSGFTVAHSVTLALGALSIVVVPASVVEPLIGLSIALTGIVGIWGERKTKKRKEGNAPGCQELVGQESVWALAGLCFGFGLLHGLGFARMLQESLKEAGSLFWPLFSFNLGVEAGQLITVLCVYPVLCYLRGTKVASPLWLMLYGSLLVLGLVVAIARIAEL